MPSTHTSTASVETIALPHGKASNVNLVLTYSPMNDTPAPDELKALFGMLDTLLNNTPFEQWENQ